MLSAVTIPGTTSIAGADGGHDQRPFVKAITGTGESVSIDPANYSYPLGIDVVQNVYETLLWYAGADAVDPVPFLAPAVPSLENGGISADGLHYTLHLRPGVRFHDGTVMDAYDVVFSIQRLLNRSDSYGMGYTIGPYLIANYSQTKPLDQEILDSVVEALDQNTVRFNLVSRYAGFPAVLAQPTTSVVSKEYVLAHFAPTDQDGQGWMATHEAGTGPYRLVEMQIENHTHLESWNRYWREPPRISSVTIVSCASSEEAFAMLLSGEADTIDDVPEWNRSEVESDPAIHVFKENLIFSTSVCGFNLDIKPGLDIGNVPGDFFRDVNVRKAFCRAFDAERYINSLGIDMIPLAGPIPAGMFGHDSSLRPATFNLTEAAHYLGLAINPATGNPWSQDGFVLNLSFMASSRNPWLQVILKEGLEEISARGYITGNIDVNLAAMNWPSYLEARGNQQLPLVLSGWSDSLADPHPFIFQELHSDGFIAQLNGLNDTWLDSQIEQAGIALDLSSRKAYYANVVDCDLQSAFYLFRCQYQDYHVERAWVRGYQFNPAFQGQYFYPLYVASDEGGSGISIVTAAILTALLACAAAIWTLGPRRERNR